MLNSKDIKEKLQRHLGALRVQYGVGRIGLFGSFVRGEQHSGSDIDLLVEFARPVGLFKFIELENQLSELLGGKVDLVTRNALKPQIGKRILGEVKYVN
jgi:predicted nucleotidyltransferase